MINLPRSLQQKRFDFEKSRRDLNKIEENLEKMKTDLNSFNITAPADGVLFYGMNKDGKWVTSAAGLYFKQNRPHAPEVLGGCGVRV